MSENKIISFKINKLQIDSFSLTPPKETIDEAKISFDVGLQWITLPEEQVIRIIVPVKIKYQATKGIIGIGEITTSTYFFIENIEEIISKDGKGINLSKEVLGTFVSIAYATARGILFEKSAGTTLKDLMLPLISPAVLIDIAQKDPITPKS